MAAPFRVGIFQAFITVGLHLRLFSGDPIRVDKKSIFFIPVKCYSQLSNHYNHYINIGFKIIV